MNIRKHYEHLKDGWKRAGSRTASLGRSIKHVLSLSLADDRVLPLQGLSVALEKGSVCVVFASRLFSRIKIRRSRRYRFTPGKYPTPENLASAVTLAINEFGAAKAQVILVIPKSWTVVKTARLPLSVLDKLSDVIAYELDRLTPLSADKAFYDYRMIERNDQHVRVMIAAVGKTALEPYLNALREKKIPVDRVTVSTSGFGTLCNQACGEGNVVFAMIDQDECEGGLMQNHVWCASFAGKLSSKDDIRGAARDINALVDSGGKENFKPRVVIARNMPERDGLVLQDSIAAPALWLGKDDLQLDMLNKNELPDMPYVALGGALELLKPRIVKMNLMDYGRHPAASTAMVLTIALLAVILALGVFWVISPLQIEKWKLEAIDREIAGLHSPVKKVEAVKKDLQKVENELASIRTFKDSRPMALNLIREMTRILPANTWLTRMRITDSAVEIEGYAASATEIVPKLEISELFKKVEFASSTSRDTRLNADRFIIKMEIEGLPEEKVKDGKKK